MGPEAISLLSAGPSVAGGRIPPCPRHGLKEGVVVFLAGVGGEDDGPDGPASKCQSEGRVSKCIPNLCNNPREGRETREAVQWLRAVGRGEVVAGGLPSHEKLLEREGRQGDVRDLRDVAVGREHCLPDPEVALAEVREKVAEGRNLEEKPTTGAERTGAGRMLGGEAVPARVLLGLGAPGADGGILALAVMALPGGTSR